MKLFSSSDQKNACSTGDTQGVTILTSDPKKAIISLSGPMIIAMLLMSSYNVVNAIWVVGLGSDALAAVGFMSSLVFAAIFAYLFAIPLGIGEQGVWWGLVAGEILGGLLAFAWARMYLLQQDNRSREKILPKKGGPNAT